MQLNPYELLRQGIYVENMTQVGKLRNLAQRLSPVKTKFELIRVGGENDGGYLLPDDLAEIDVCFSPGVDYNASFEHDLFQKTGILSHLADFSVDGPPGVLKHKSFTKKFLGCTENDKTITLDSWVNIKENIHSSNDFILQMDIEGAEYATLLNTSLEVLHKFRIIVLEIHNTHAWGQMHFFNIAENLFDKLLEFYYVVHNHPNNNDGLIDLGGFSVPRTFELTLLRKDRSCPYGFCSKFPHPLDRRNVLHCDDLTLPQGWFIQRNENQDKVRALLCRPRGGINDLLCSIEKCWTYADKTNRKLLIDSSFSGLYDNFWNYFQPIAGYENIEFNLNYELFDSIDVLPKSIQGRVSCYRADYSNTQGGYRDQISGELISFDFNSDFDISLLVHEEGRQVNYLSSLDLLRKLRLNERVKLDITRRLKLLPEKYTGIHIRHTDYLTDYESFLTQLKSELEGKNVLICSDNLQVIDYIKSEFTQSNVIRLSTFEDNRGWPLHVDHSGSHQYNKNIEALTDLFALALADNIYLTNVQQLQAPSGFSLLAMGLYQNKDVVKSLLSW